MRNLSRILIGALALAAVGCKLLGLEAGVTRVGGRQRPDTSITPQAPGTDRKDPEQVTLVAAFVSMGGRLNRCVALVDGLPAADTGFARVDIQGRAIVLPVKVLEVGARHALRLEAYLGDTLMHYRDTVFQVMASPDGHVRVAFEVPLRKPLVFTPGRGTLPANPAPAGPDVGLAARYLLDGDARDETGNRHDGAVRGASPALDRFLRPGHALGFDGRDDIVVIPHHAHLDVGNAFTLSLWYRRDGEDLVSQQYILDKGYPEGYQVYASGGFLSATFSGPTSLSHSLAEPGAWIHLVVTRDGPWSSLYIDGEYRTSYYIHSALEASAADLTLGGRRTSMAKAFRGILDDIRIYRRAFSDAEVSRLHDLEKSL